MAEKTIRTCALTTPFEENTALGWENEYPRPQLKRESFISLTGTWTLAVEKADGIREKLGEITVPYPPESRISGYERQLGENEKYIYSRTFTLEEDLRGKKVLVHFGAVDTQCIIYVNDRLIGGHVGGYIPFTIDITDLAKQGENKIKVEVEDRLDTDYSYGKQTKNRGGMWYTPISGIWQPAWVEILPQNHIEKLKITPALDSVTVETVGGRTEKTIEIETSHGAITHKYTGDRTVINIENPVHWTPENPHLYNFTLTCGEDKLRSYFALRTVTVENVEGQQYICLNGRPYFFHGLLDQGYFSDGIYTPASPEGYIYDILTMKGLGFNTLRKHIKVEPDLFYHYCDKYGMIVFQDMMNTGEYNYLIDTILPNGGLKKGITHKPTEKRRRFFEKECRDMVDALYNHPSVCYYTIFNEGWGQYEADRIYTELKAVDSTRVWDATSGWFKEKLSDVDSEHIYFRKVKLKARAERPLVLSEFGGFACKTEGHVFNLSKEYGYRSFKDKDGLTAGLEKLYYNQIVPCIRNGLNAAILTQVSDVEDEVNGLVTYDRQVVKVDRDRMKAIARQLFKEFEKKING